MPSQAVDAIVLGAGIVGVSAALALQARGRTVAIVDRLGEAAGETSYGNTGIVQTEAIFPYLFPREPAEIALAALNRNPQAHIRYGALPAIAPALWRYFRASNDAVKNETARAMAPFLGAAAAEHVRLAEAAGARPLLRATGWIKAYRTARGEDEVHEEAEELKPYGIVPTLLDRAALDGARAACRGGRARRGAFPRSADDAEPAGADARLCRAVRQPRRSDGDGRRAESRTLARRVDGDDQFRSRLRPRRCHRARGMVRRPCPLARASPAVLRQARLPHALRGARRRRRSTGRCSISRRAMC